MAVCYEQGDILSDSIEGAQVFFCSYIIRVYLATLPRLSPRLKNMPSFCGQGQLYTRQQKKCRYVGFIYIYI